MSAPDSLEVCGLGVLGPNGPITSDISFRVGPGEITAVAGPSGSGKTTTIHAIAGCLAPGLLRQGGVYLNGQRVGHITAARGKWNGISLISQRPLEALNPVLSVGRILDAVTRGRLPELTRGERQRVVESVLSAVELSSEMGHRVARELSGGERQRVQLAAALIGNPKLILADEPTAALDVIARRSLLRSLTAILRQRRIPAVIATHDHTVIQDFCDNAAILTGGTIAAIVAASTVREQPVFQASHRRTTRLVLEARGLGKSFAARPVLSGLHLKLFEQNTLGVGGRSGCGKTTLARCLAGLIAPDSGSILLDRSTAGRHQVTRPSPAIQLIFQEPHASFDPRLSLLESLAEAWILAGRRRGKKISPMVAALQSLAKVGIQEDMARRLPRDVSGGECQRAAIARALIEPPTVLIADEPASGLDPEWTYRIMALLYEMQSQYRFALVLISHNMQLLAGMCGEIAVMESGQVVEHGETRQLIETPHHPVTSELVLASFPSSFRRANEPSRS